MGVFRFENKYAAPTKEQRERYMKGEREEHHFGPDGQIVLILWPEAAYLKDDIDNVRILFTGFHDKQKVQDEVRRLVEYHQQNDNRTGSSSPGNEDRYCLHTGAGLRCFLRVCDARVLRRTAFLVCDLCRKSLLFFSKRERVDYPAAAAVTWCGSPWSQTSEKYRAMKIMKTGFTIRTRTQPMTGINDRIPVMTA